MYNPQTRQDWKDMFLEQHHRQRDEEGTRIVGGTLCRRGVGLILEFIKEGRGHFGYIVVKKVSNDPV